jgi:hypothetical protein
VLFRQSQQWDAMALIGISVRDAYFYTGAGGNAIRLHGAKIKNRAPFTPCGASLYFRVETMTSMDVGADVATPARIEDMVSVFFDADGLQRMLTFLCNARLPGSWDPVTSTVVDMLTGRLHFCLTSEGLSPFRGKADLVFPYHMMSQRQKNFLRDALSVRSGYCVCNDAVVFNPSPGAPDRLDHLRVLEGVCARILASKIHEEHRVRVGVCNIILQRVQSVVPISRGVQKRLNAVLFGVESERD